MSKQINITCLYGAYSSVLDNLIKAVNIKIKVYAKLSKLCSKVVLLLCESVIQFKNQSVLTRAWQNKIAYQI